MSLHDIVKINTHYTRSINLERDSGSVDVANLVHGVGLLRTCARAGDVGPVDDLGEVLYMDRAPSVEELVNTIHMRRDPESPGSYLISLSHQFRVPLRNHPDSASVGYSSFRWRNPEVTWTHGGFGDVVALYGIEARDGSDSPLVKLSTIYPPLSRYGEVVCSVVPNFPLLYRFPTAAELASPTVSLSAHGPPQRSRQNWP